MKTKTCLLLSLAGLLLNSCATEFYQLYKTEAPKEIVQKNGSLVYEDTNCQVFYNLWNDKGNPGFRFHNKTDDDIYINMAESFFILNGIANNYYKERIFTQTGGSTIHLVSYYFAVAGSASNSVSVSKKEEDIICVPSMTSKIISEYVIMELPLKFCDYKHHPLSTTKTKTLYFTKNDSPVIFTNRITYWVGKAGPPVKFFNEFYVTEITNYHSSKFLTEEAKDECGKDLNTLKKVYKNPSPDKFYVKYTLEN